MKLPNQLTSDLLGKNNQKSINAAQQIINNPDVEAWKCLLENSDFIFSFIKEKAGIKILNQINKENCDKVFELLKYHASDWDEYIAVALSRIADEKLNEKMLELLENGSTEEKIYAARYFCMVDYKKAATPLFEGSKEYSQNLKSNCAEALGKLKDKDSYEYYFERLSSDDEWDRIEAAQFLANYGNKEATVAILEAMSTSGMAELIAGEIATLTDLHLLFDEQEESTQLLALEAMDNIISGVPEVWPLGTILDFKIYECIEKLLQLAKENRRSSLIGKYAQILIKTKLKIHMFMNNSQYTYDEEKDILAELDEIYHLLIYEDDEFWAEQQKRLYKELESKDRKRKLAAISVLSDMDAEESSPFLIKVALKQDEDEAVICEAITTLAKWGHTKEIDKTLLLSRIKTPNLQALVEQAFSEKTAF